MAPEKWKAIREFEGLYEISNFGRVRSFMRKGIWKTIIKKAFISPYGYQTMTLCKNGKQHPKQEKQSGIDFYWEKNKLNYQRYLISLRVK